MARAGGLVISAILSLLYVIVGFWKLLQFRKYFEFVLVFAVYFGLALVLYFGFIYSYNLENANIRVWVVAPLIILLLVWLMSGFFIRKYVLDVTNVNSSPHSTNPNMKLRFIGAIIFCTGLGVWLYGRFSPFSESIFIWALIFSLLCMIFGGLYLVTGKRISE
jgi:hypothetical protein